MKPIIALLAVATLGSAVVTAPAQAQSRRYDVPRPPVMVSPDVSDPWLVEVRRDRYRYDARPRFFGNRDFEPRYARERDFEHRYDDRSWRRDARDYTPPRDRDGIRMAARPNPAVTRAIDPAFLPTVVDYRTREAPGTIIIDTEARYLYLVLGDGQAKRYGVGVGRPGFSWAGTHRVTRKAEWPDWTPPEEMRRRQPGLPTHMEGGPNNPLGARAMYLGSTLYRIHGSNEPWTIGHAVSSGCIRMRNEDVIDLYERVKVGTKVIVS